MKPYSYIIIGFHSFFICCTGCKQQYLPPVARANLGFLVVDGMILNGQDTTIIHLSRSQNLTDSTYVQIPETGARLSITGQNSEVYPLTETDSGTYKTSNLNLQNGAVYRMNIRTANGNVYLSDALEVKYNPPIDSISWKWLTDGVYIYANTHDPSGSTRYYRWEYSESWEYHTAYISAFKIVNGAPVQRDSGEYINKCWTTRASTDLLLGSSANLSRDVIYEYPVMFIPAGSQKISVGYSLLVTQYALSQEAFQYWQALKKSTEQTGSLFDPQPTETNGNIHNLANSNEPVLGYVSITSRHQQRIFISNADLPGWPYEAPGLKCDRFIADPQGAGYWSLCDCIPLYHLSLPNGVIGFYATSPGCADCTLQGGKTAKPAFWPL